MKPVLKWFFGIFFLLAGIGAMTTSSFLVGLIYTLVGLFLIPPILKSFENGTNMQIPSNVKYIVVIGGILIGLITTAFYKDIDSTSNNSESTTSYKPEAESKPRPQKKVAPKQISVGDVLRTEYFDVIVNAVGVQDRVRTGNEFTRLKPEAGIMYLIIDVTYKNIDNESRMVTEGSVFIQYSGKVYEYDHSEAILSDGYGFLLEQLNPLTSKRTKIVYKIPTEINGPAYYEPGRSSNGKRIFLGTLQQPKAK